MRRRLPSTLFFVFMFAFSAAAADYRVEALDADAPVDDLSDEVTAQIGSSGFRLIRGTSSTLCDVWLCKQLPAKADFESSSEHLYPFHPGQLIGILRYGRRGDDFRDQQLSRGVYTLRYALQPVDGNHEGTSITRDFLLLVRAEDDQSAKPMEMEQLNELAADAAEASHPAMLCLQKAEEKPGDVPSIRHDEDRDWWIARFVAKTVAGDKTASLPIELVVVGIADE